MFKQTGGDFPCYQSIEVPKPFTWGFLSTLKMPTCKTPGCLKRKGVIAGGYCPKCVENTDATFCGHCKDEVQEDQQGMCCIRCEVWFHLSCVNISTALYDLLMQKEDDEDDGFRWYCPACRNKSADITNDKPILLKLPFKRKSKVLSLKLLKLF